MTVKRFVRSQLSPDARALLMEPTDSGEVSSLLLFDPLKGRGLLSMPSQNTR